MQRFMSDIINKLKSSPTSSWNADAVHLLGFGFVRKHLNHIKFTGIGNIIVAYITSFRISCINNPKYSHVYYEKDDELNTTLICDFSINNTEIKNTHYGSTIIFKPFISQLLSKIDSRRSAEISIECKKLVCNHSYYDKTGYNFQCGLICLPKIYNRVSDDDNNDIDVKQEDDVAKDNESESESLENRLKKMENIFSNISKFENDSCWLESINNICEDKDILYHIKEKNKNGNEKIQIRKFDFDFSQISTLYLYCAHWINSRHYDCHFGKDENFEHCTLYRQVVEKEDASRDYVFTTGDSITLSITQNNMTEKKSDKNNNGNNNIIGAFDDEKEKEKPKEKAKEKEKENATTIANTAADTRWYNLQFIKNKNFDNFIMGWDKTSVKQTQKGNTKVNGDDKDDVLTKIHEFDHGTILLDFENYDYLFAMGSVKCDCQSMEKITNKDKKFGFQFQISYS